MSDKNRDISLAVVLMQEYIQTHLHEPLTSKDIAKSAGYSQYHAARLFKEETGVSPFEYIRRERLIQSAHILRSGKSRVLDIALDFVFDSHEGFTRAFTNAFGITPKKIRKSTKFQRLADSLSFSRPPQNQIGGVENGDENSGYFHTNYGTACTQSDSSAEQECDTLF